MIKHWNIYANHDMARCFETAAVTYCTAGPAGRIAFVDVGYLRTEKYNLFLGS